MRTFVSLLVVVLWFMPSLAWGQDYVRYRLPPGRRLTVSGETFQGFNLGEYRELLHMDNDLRELTATHDLDLARISALTVTTAELRSALGVCNAQVHLLDADRSRITALWEEENRLRIAAEEANDWVWVPWTLAGGFAIATVVLGIIVGIQ